jgi:hypothetical protein
MAHRNIATHFAPANNTLALMVRRGSDELVAKPTIVQDCVLKAAEVSVIGNTYTPYQPQQVGVRAGRTVWFVQSGYPGLSYIVVEKPEGFSCSCKDARNGLPCQHTDDVVSYEARCREEAEAEKIARIAEEVGVPVREVAIIAHLAGHAQSVDPISEAQTFIAWVLSEKARKGAIPARDCVDEAMDHIRAMQVEEAATRAAQPKYSRRTEQDASLQAQWGSPVYDEAHYRARFERRPVAS